MELSMTEAAAFVERMRAEVGTIAHSCGVAHPRALKRYHCRICQANGRSIPLDELYPVAEPANAVRA